MSSENCNCKFNIVSTILFFYLVTLHLRICKTIFFFFLLVNITTTIGA